MLCQIEESVKDNYEGLLGRMTQVKISLFWK